MWNVARQLTAMMLALWLGTGSALPARAQAPGQRGGSFELVDQHGQRFASAALAGKPYAIFFGFTHCPDVCPTTLLGMSNNLASLGTGGDRLKVVFVTVDPDRDTPEKLRQYLASFDPRIIALTGKAEEIAAAAKGWGVFYDKVPEDDGGYTMAHSAYVYLMDGDNHKVDTLGFQEPEDQQLAKLRRLIAPPDKGRK